MKYLKSILGVAFCLFVFTACDAGKDVDVPGNQVEGNAEVLEQASEGEAPMPGEDNVMMENKTIAQIISESEQYTILENALKSAGMFQMFKSGSYTVIAPNNKAFEELDEGTLEMWLMEENKDKLAKVLKYHVIDQPITASDLQDMTTNSVQGSPLVFEVEEDGEVQIDGFEVEYIVHASNGVIYVTGEVFMPKDVYEGENTPSGSEGMNT